MTEHVPNPADPDKNPVALQRDIRVLKPLTLTFGKNATPPKAAPAPKKKKQKPLLKGRYDKEGTTPLYRAAARSDIATVRRLLKEGYDPAQSCRDNPEETPLMAAGRNRQTDIARLLTAAGAPVGEAALDIAINYTIGHYKNSAPEDRADFVMIDGWIKQGNSGADLSRFMHNAAHACDLPLVEKLAGAGADINHRREWARPYSLEKGERTPVMCAIYGEGDNIDTVRGMIRLGANAQDAYTYALGQRRYGDDAFAATTLGAFLTEAVKGNLVDNATAKDMAHEGLVQDYLKNPPPGLKYSGRPITRTAVENHLRRRR
ncbi:MAG: ankyrin repeat domain-containing protein [Alphaproteobacteria bacterium]|nr:MAG: ankyrin repeat domain-containing protein [Alphaproteobacteria bacterium]